MESKNISIVGGGPAGSTCGYYLAKAGFDVTIYEAAPNTRKSCGGGLRRAIFKKFDQFCEFIAEPAYESLKEELKQYNIKSGFNKEKGKSINFQIDFFSLARSS